MLWSVEQCVSSNDWSSLHENIQKRPFPIRLPPINNLSKQSSAAGLRACVASSCMELGPKDYFNQDLSEENYYFRQRAFPLLSCVTRSHCGRNFSPKKAAFSRLKWPGGMAGSCSSSGQELWELGQLAFYLVLLLSRTWAPTTALHHTLITRLSLQPNRLNYRFFLSQFREALFWPPPVNFLSRFLAASLLLCKGRR